MGRVFQVVARLWVVFQPRTREKPKEKGPVSEALQQKEMAGGLVGSPLRRGVIEHHVHEKQQAEASLVHRLARAADYVLQLLICTLDSDVLFLSFRAMEGTARIGLGRIAGHAAHRLSLDPCRKYRAADAVGL